MGLLGTVAASFDRAVTLAVSARNKRSRAEKLSHDERMKALVAIRDSYASAFDDFFTRPDPISPSLARVREMRGGVRVSDASWRSEYEPYLVALREKYLAYEMNRTAAARVYLAPKPRPTIVLIHGYLAGQWTLEERAWPIRWLAERYDLVLPLLPFHALRGTKGRPPPFPGTDPRMTNEGFRQAVFDLRGLIDWLRARGAPSIGVMGMSLGGYTTSLLATVERDLAFAVPIIPLASLSDWAREQGRLGDGEEARLQHAALDEANRIVSPLARPSLVPSSRVLIVAASADRITPISHAERLSRHFGARLVKFEGGHLLQFGRGDAFREIGRWLTSS